MARTRTDAAERAKQRRDLVDQVSAELGRKVGVREAQRYRAEQKNKPTHLVADRMLDIDPADLRHIGQVLGRPKDYKEMSGYAQITVQVSTEFGHLLLDASRLGEGDALVITFEAIAMGHAEADE